MKTNIIISGFGGQGIVAAGRAIAYAGIEDDMHVSVFPSYGPEMRGGAANCHVIISDAKIASPIISNTDVALIMSMPALKKFESQIRQDGTLIIDSYQVKESPTRTDINIIKIPATEIAAKIGSTKFANIVMIGAMIKLLEVPSPKGMLKAIEELLSKGKEALIPLEIKALNSGINFIE